jgi:small nuclear ribonucleoprotein (snRNP)-like protein
MASVQRTTKLMGYVNYRMRVTVADGRQIVGRFMAFDKHMNLVLGDAEEFRKLPPKKGKSDDEVRVLLCCGDAFVVCGALQNLSQMHMHTG